MKKNVSKISIDTLFNGEIFKGKGILQQILEQEDSISPEEIDKIVEKSKKDFNDLLKKLSE